MKHVALIFAASLALCAAAAGQSRDRWIELIGGRDQGWLGVSVQDVTKNLAEKKGLKVSSGAYVTDVSEDSPAEAAGILEGDVIVKFGDRGIDDRDELVRAVRRSRPGDEVAVVVDRKGQSKTLTAKLDELETPRAFSLTVPDIPAVAPAHPRAPGMTFFRSGERLGMELQTLGRQLAEFLEVPGNRGVLVSAVAKKGAAATAGVKAGDVIVKVNRSSVRDVDDVLDEIRDAEEAAVPFEVIRKGKPVTVTIDVGGEEDLSGIYDDARREHRDALRKLKEDRGMREEILRDLKESLREMKRDLQEGALELKQVLREHLHES